MKEKFGYWFSIGTIAGILLGIAMKHLAAGFTLGIITGLLLALVQSSSTINKLQ